MREEWSQGLFFSPHRDTAHTQQFLILAFEFRLLCLVCQPYCFIFNIMHTVFRPGGQQQSPSTEYLWQFLVSAKIYFSPSPSLSFLTYYAMHHLHSRASERVSERWGHRVLFVSWMNEYGWHDSSKVGGVQVGESAVATCCLPPVCLQVSFYGR